MVEPIYLKEFNIYDIFYNDNNKIVIICPQLVKKSKPLNISFSDNINNKFKSFVCKHNHTIVYISNNISYTEYIDLLINDTKIKTYVNRYPNFENEIIMSTMVKNEDNYIIQWIEYHLLLGIKRFIIYDNANSPNTRYSSKEKISNLQLLLDDYIKKKVVILIKWIYPKNTKETGNSGQTTQQNHSIYAFKNSKYIGLFDIDEYINPQVNCINLDNIFDNVINLNKLDINNLSGFSLFANNFMNPKKLDDTGYNFLKIYDTNNDFSLARSKMFVIPKNVNMFSVHIITNGCPRHIINKDIIYFNHYIFLNKNGRGFKKTTTTNNSIEKILKFINI